MRGLIATTVLTLVMSISVEKCVFAQQEQPGTRTVVKKVLPVYSDIARRLQLRGIVKVEVIVPPNGTVKSSRVIGGSPLLARSATEAIEKWKWAPAPGETKELVELSFHPE